MKKFVSFVLALAMLLSLCSLSAVAEGADTKGTGVELTVYTNSGSSGRSEWLIDRAAKDGFKLVQDITPAELQAAIDSVVSG